MATKLTAGQVEVELAGTTYILAPTIKACLDLSRRWKGFENLQRAVLGREIDAVVDVVAAGARIPGSSPGTDRAAVEKAVFETGFVLTPLLGRLVEFLAILQNGGRPIRDEAQEPAPGEAQGG